MLFTALAAVVGVIFFELGGVKDEVVIDSEPAVEGVVDEVAEEVIHSIQDDDIEPSQVQPG